MLHEGCRPLLCRDGTSAAREPGTVVIQSEERHDRLDVRSAVNEVADPARLWIDMVRLDAAGLHEVVADGAWFFQICQTVAVEVPQLTPAVSEFGAAETVR